MGLPVSAPVMWLIILVLTLIVEAATAGLVTIWFSIGALAALVASCLGLGFAWQIVLFVIVSVAALLFTRPLVKNKLHKTKVKTNADLVISKQAVVIEDICPIDGKGQVKVDGKVWSAKSENGQKIAKGELVTVEKIEGVHLIVK